jgi:hypothetical protein
MVRRVHYSRRLGRHDWTGPDFTDKPSSEKVQKVISMLIACFFGVVVVGRGLFGPSEM